MERHLVLHDSTGSFLLVEPKVGNQQSPNLPSLTFFSYCQDEIAWEAFAQVAVVDERDTLEPPLTVRYNVMNTEGQIVATVFELLCRRCALALRAGYKWASITPVFLQRMKDSYSPFVWHAINNIAAETLENASNLTLPVLAKRGFVKHIRSTIRSRLKQCERGGSYSVIHRTVSSDASVFSVCFDEKKKETPLYFKIAEPSRPEALFTQTLGRLLPELVVAPFEVDVTNNSFFTEDFGQTVGFVVSMYDEEPVTENLYRSSVETIAEFHQDASKHVEKFRKLGMEDTSPRQMRIELPDFASKVQEMGILTEEEAQFMRKGMPKLFSFLDDLASGKVPLTVCHGDLHSGNVAMPASEGDRPLLFDWYYSTISHPFFDICCSHFTEPELLELYYEKWTSYDSRDEIQRLYFVARSLEPLWDVFRRVKLMEKREYQLGAEQILDHCRIMLKRFVNEPLHVWLNE